MFLPVMPKGNKPNIKYELGVLTRLPVVLALLTTVFGASALFALYTYIAPFLTNTVHISESHVAVVLVIIGLGFTIGNYLEENYLLTVSKNINPFLHPTYRLYVSFAVSFP